MKSTPLLAIALAALLSGCNKSSETPGQLRVAVIPKGTTHIYWKSVEAGALKAGTELGVKVTVLHEGSVLAEGPLDQVSANERVVEVYLGR